MRLRASTSAVTLVAAVAAATLGAIGWLVVRGMADVWRGPTLIPQHIGTRGIDIAFANELAGAWLTSLVIAVVGTIIGCALTLPAVTALTRSTKTVRRVAITMLVVPALVPGNIVGLGLSTLITRLGFDGRWIPVLVAHLPFVIAWQAVSLIATIDGELPEREDAAAALGLPPARRLIHVTIPGVRRALWTALPIGFLVSWAQYATSLLVGRGADTLPLRLGPFVTSDPQVASVMTIAYVAPALVVGSFVVLKHRKLEA